MEFVNYKCLESLLTEGEEIALEGILSKLKNKSKVSNNLNLPDGMKDSTALHRYIDDKKLYNKTESETTDNAYGGQSFERVINEDKHNPHRYVAGLDFVIHSYQSPQSKYPMWIVISIDMDTHRPIDFIIPYIKKNNVEFKFTDVVKYINSLPEYK